MCLPGMTLTLVVRRILRSLESDYFHSRLCPSNTGNLHFSSFVT
jgi:hypothetical protein